LSGISRDDLSWADTTRRSGPSWGDLAALALLLIMVTPDQFFQTILFLGERPPHGIFRHGLLAPLHCLVIHDLALNRGWLARILSHRMLEKLGEASFGIFILQGPIGFPVLMMLPRHWPALVRLLITVAVVVAVSLLSVRYFERPVARKLKRWLAIGAS
jgi:peptidoglycan/LPS O-acetylase OafA/YrhL